ncbi:cyanocobalamin reductase / alkylcobalamin dealkylase-like [Tigriopus californicus]|uniref:cyanocobalamin reductase / alkylcobalamin dealkylase-like n=1 Tax=Tigriopus californicus TaxID=6832 RepID=UPI0027DA21C5|nr:cyanocobalamin reductase / alkylcobalamin dealkylase-like [Tigriopus californicus]|eukprot:TCALIF_12163-PA protein Name:"Similar to MMACHC Methylmalonic aciduria and homocystinuria type C protein homolog (Gallus gallus)" AED:0.43 eAED:0.43 QI:0/-1/0/1/-1/1/1/0/266
MRASNPDIPTPIGELSIVQSLGERLNVAHFHPGGFEAHPFLVKSYNELVGPKFRLDYPDHTLAWVVLSRPSMFENTFLPFLKRTKNDPGVFDRDPLDQCMWRTFQDLKEQFEPEFGRIDVMHDFEIRPNRRPKILVQTAAHVSGSVRLFRESDVTEDPSLLKPIQSPKIYPVCLHPIWSGWFAIRGVFLFRDIQVDPPVLASKPCDLELPEALIAELLRLYNDHWQDCRFRDSVHPAREKYSSVQQDYFAAKPAERIKVIEPYLAS